MALSGRKRSPGPIGSGVEFCPQPGAVPFPKIRSSAVKWSARVMLPWKRPLQGFDEPILGIGLR